MSPAQNIWDDARLNTLTKPGRLDGYLKSDPGSIDRWGGQDQMTPLQSACYSGNTEVVNLLLQHKANPNALCPNKRTALYYVLRQNPAKATLIVKALLDAKPIPANPNETYPSDDNGNPLTLAILLHDKDLMQLLVDAEAKPTEENKIQAKSKGLEGSLTSWKKKAESLVDLAVNAVSLIISYTEGGAIGSLAKGVMGKMYKITSAQQNPVAKVRSFLYDYTDFMTLITFPRPSPNQNLPQILRRILTILWQALVSRSSSARNQSSFRTSPRKPLPYAMTQAPT
jgi:Ankyrin repeats (3 copies)